MRDVALDDVAVLREVCLRAGAVTSLHFHEATHEVNFVVGGKVRMRYGSDPDHLKDQVLSTGDVFVTTPGMIHVALHEAGEFGPGTDARLVEMIIGDTDDAIRLAPGRAGSGEQTRD